MTCKAGVIIKSFKSKDEIMKAENYLSVRLKKEILYFIFLYSYFWLASSFWPLPCWRNSFINLKKRKNNWLKFKFRFEFLIIFIWIINFQKIFNFSWEILNRTIITQSKLIILSILKMKRSISSIDDISALIRENSIKSAGLSTLDLGKRWAFDVSIQFI